MTIEAVVFDLDGVIVESERSGTTCASGTSASDGGRYDAEAQRAMMGMSSTEWSRFIHEELRGRQATPAEINADVVELMAARYREHLPLDPRRAGGGGANGARSSRSGSRRPRIAR